MQYKIIIKLLLCILGHFRMQALLKARELGSEMTINNLVPEDDAIREAQEYLDK